MAHFAKLNENNIVLKVVVLDNEVMTIDGVEREDVGVTFLQNIFGGIWKQTSYNNRMRKNYAGMGYTYDEVRDAFIAPQPYASWVLNESTCLWDAPSPKPNDGKQYFWDESTISWVEVPATQP